MVSATPEKTASADTPSAPQGHRHVKVPAITRLAAEPEQVTRKVVPVEAAAAAEVRETHRAARTTCVPPVPH
ncbi:hypothetical protein MRX96_017266 [Rhipicephalus microplus]